MTRKTLALISTAVVVIIVLTVAAGASGWIERFALGKARTATGRSISVDHVSIDWGWPVTRVTADNLVLGNVAGGSAPDMLSLPQLQVAINAKGIFNRRILFEEIILDKPKLLLEKDAKGQANWQFSDNPTAAAGLDAVTPEDRTDIPAIGRLLIQNGTLIYKDPAKKTDLMVQANSLESRNKGKTDGTLDIKGAGRYQGHDFKVDVSGGTIFQLQDDSNPYPIDATFVVGSTRAHLKGTMQDPLQMKGLDLALTLAGKNAAELFDVIGVALPPTPPYDVTGQLDYADKVWNFKKFKGKLGSSDLTGSLTWNTSLPRPLLSGELLSERLDLKDLGGLVGAPTPDGNGEKRAPEQQKLAEQQAASQYLIPETPLDISRLKSMDAKVSFIGKKLISNNLPLDDFEMRVNLDNSLLKLTPLRFGTANGDIIANMTVNARQEPVQISGDFDFRKLQLKPIFAALSSKLGQPNYADGAIGGKARLAGTGKSLRDMLSTAKGDIGLGMEGGRISNLIVELLGLDVAESAGFLVAGDKPVPVRCVIGDFAVDHGMMNVRHFIIDTTDSNIQGTGSINLKNEALDLTLRTQAKDNTLLSLNSPISLRGTLKNPEVKLDVAKVAARGALATAAAFIFPPAIALAFVETGLGKDSQCGQLLNTMALDTGAKQEIPKNKK